MADAPTIIEIIRNGTLSAEMAATLWAAMDRRLSFVVVAIPRFAGKSTVGNAILSFLPSEVPIHRITGDAAQMEQLKREATGGYLAVGEFSEAPVPSYIWGEPVRRLFDTLEAGYSLSTALHAPSLQEAFDAICKGNGVSDEGASRLDLIVYIRRFGDDLENFWRRIAEVHEVDRVEGGRPQGRLLYRWVEEDNRFERVEAARFLQGDDADLAARAALLSELANSGRTSLDNVAALVAQYHSQK